MTRTAYPYASRNLFDEPEYYHFAKCATADFYRCWRDYRDARTRELKAVATEYDLTAFSSGPAACDGEQVRPLRSILLRVLDLAEQGSMDKAAEALEPYVVKYEVYRRLFDRFLPNNLRHPESRLAGWGDYVLFAHALARIAIASDSLKHLSTLLKICDALTSVPVSTFNEVEAALLARTLEIEGEAARRLDEQYALP